MAMNQSGVNLHVYLFVEIEAKKKEGSERSNPKRTAGLCGRINLFLMYSFLNVR